MQKTEWNATTYKNEKGMWTVFSDICKGCGLCMAKCPKKCMKWSKELGVYGTPRVEANVDECIFCGICQMACPDCAILVEKAK